MSQTDRGALRQVTTATGIRLQTTISWMPPTLELPPQRMPVLLVFECQPDRILSGIYDADLKAFFLDGSARIVGDSFSPRQVRFWSPSSLDQQ